MLRRFRRGQSTAEYAIVIGLVIAAAVAMQVYVKRGVQAKMKDASDYKDPDSVTVLKTAQYEPDYATTEGMVSTRNSSETAITSKGGGIVRSIDGADVSNRTGVTKISGIQ